MGGDSSKKCFTEWDLIEFSNITGVPLPTVEKIYKEFLSAIGNQNRMDKKEFRRLYKEMYFNGQNQNNIAPFLTDHDLDKMSDHVFETYDFDASGKLTFEEFAEIYLMLSHYSGSSSTNGTRRNRFNYIIDQYDTSLDFITREYGEQVFDRVNIYNTLSNWNKSTDASKSNQKNWEHHWNKLDDGTGRVSKEKFLDYVTKSDDDKTHSKPTTI